MDEIVGEKVGDLNKYNIVGACNDSINNNLNQELNENTLQVHNIVHESQILIKYRNILSNISLIKLKEHFRTNITQTELPDILLESIKKENISVEIDKNQQPLLLIKVHLRTIKCKFLNEYIDFQEDRLLTQYKLIAFLAFVGAVSKENIDQLTIAHCLNNKEKGYIEFQFNSEPDTPRRIMYKEIQHPSFWQKKKNLLKAYGIQG